MKTSPSGFTSWNKSAIWRPVLGKLLLLGCIFAVASRASAQEPETPRVQVFGGYSYTHFDSKTFGYSGGSDLNGGTVMVAGNLLHNFGGLAQVSVSGGAGITLRDMLFGPQYLYPRGNFLFFAHALFGRARASVNAPTQALNDQIEPLDTQNELAFGGGVDMSFRNRFSIRLAELDYTHTSLFQQDQNNLRFSAGIVYHWGAIRRRLHRAPSIPTPEGQ
jgi:hypothetical protein